MFGKKSSQLGFVDFDDPLVAGRQAGGVQVIAALAAFNLGIEVGQLAFAAAIITCVRLGRSLIGRISDERRAANAIRVAAWPIGLVASTWFMQRLSAL